jgi:hypothetical protein
LARRRIGAERSISTRLFGRLFENGKGTDAADLGNNQVFGGLIGGLGKTSPKLFQFGSSRPSACDFAIAFHSSHARIVPCLREFAADIDFPEFEAAPAEMPL